MQIQHTLLMGFGSMCVACTYKQTGINSTPLWCITEIQLVIEKCIKKTELYIVLIKGTHFPKLEKKIGRSELHKISSIKEYSIFTGQGKIKIYQLPFKQSPKHELNQY